MEDKKTDIKYAKARLELFDQGFGNLGWGVLLVSIILILALITGVRLSFGIVVPGYVWVALTAANGVIASLVLYFITKAVYQLNTLHNVAQLDVIQAERRDRDRSRRNG